MKPESNQAPDHDPSVVRPVCGALALLFGAVAAFILFNSISSSTGWSVLFGALTFAHLAFTYTPASDTSYVVSRPRLLGILAACIVPPLLLLLAFFDRPGWRQPLIVAFLLCISLGPVILLRRYARRPAGSKNDRNT
jgi:hypothetical protein